MCVSAGQKYLFFRKFGGLCFLAHGFWDLPFFLITGDLVCTQKFTKTKISSFRTLWLTHGRTYHRVRNDEMFLVKFCAHTNWMTPKVKEHWPNIKMLVVFKKKTKFPLENWAETWPFVSKERKIFRSVCVIYFIFLGFGRCLVYRKQACNLRRYANQVWINAMTLTLHNQRFL